MGNEDQRRESARTDVPVLDLPLTHCMCVRVYECVCRVSRVCLCVCVSARVCVSMCPCGSALLACVRVQDDVPVSGLCVCALCGVYVCAPMWQRRMQRVFLQSPGRAVRQASHLSLLLLFSLHRTNSFPSSWAQIHLIHSFIPENTVSHLHGPCQPPPYTPNLGPSALNHNDYEGSHLSNTSQLHIRLCTQSFTFIPFLNSHDNR